MSYPDYDDRDPLPRTCECRGCDAEEYMPPFPWVPVPLDAPVIHECSVPGLPPLLCEEHAREAGLAYCYGCEEWVREVDMADDDDCVRCATEEE